MIGLQDLPFDLSGLGIRAAAKVWMLQRKYLWQLFLPTTINGVLGLSVSQFCQDVAFGPYGLSDVFRMQHGAFMRFYAGLQDIKSVSMQFLLPEDNTVLDYFWGWYYLMIDERGYHYPKLHYSKQMYLSLYSRSGIETVKFIMKGAFPIMKPVIHVSTGANEVETVGITFSVDNIEMWSLAGAARSSIAGILGNSPIRAAVGTVASNAGLLYGGGGLVKGVEGLSKLL